MPTSSRSPIFLVVALALAAGVAAFFAVRKGLRDDAPALAPDPVVVPRGDFHDDEKARIALFQAVKDSVVNVDTLSYQRDYDYSLIERQQGTGSGFVWDEAGHIVTNFHVIQDAARNRNLTVRIRLADRTTWNARLVAIAPDYDLAVAKIDAPKSQLKPIKVGTSSDLQVGQDVFAIGNPFGQNLTFTRGIISSLGREIQSPSDQPIRNAIQTDAALNPGNSGGPLMDWEGRLVGVNTAIASPSGGSTGVGFAIPVDTVREVVPQLIREGRTVKPTLGIVGLREQFARNGGVERGVVVQEVRPGGAAAKAGIVPIRPGRNGAFLLGDVILSVGGDPVNSMKDIDGAIGRRKVGDKVKLSVQRDDAVRDVEVVLEGV